MPKINRIPEETALPIAKVPSIAKDATAWRFAIVDSWQADSFDSAWHFDSLTRFDSVTMFAWRLDSGDSAW